MELFKEYFYSGALEKGKLEDGFHWAGEKCLNYIPLCIHVIEATLWIAAHVYFYYSLNLPKLYTKTIDCLKEINSKNPLKPGLRRTVEGWMDLIFAIILIGLYVQLIYYKTVSKCLIYLLFQPCHILLIIQAMALLSKDDITSFMLTVLHIPIFPGPISALVCADTTGLDLPFEALAYYVQHWLIVLMPIYLVLRRNGVVYRLLLESSLGMKTLLPGTWIVFMLHWTVIYGVDLVTTVNAEFMLCPTPAMEGVFAVIPEDIRYFYRSLLNFFVGWGLIYPICITYSYLGKFINVFLLRTENDDKSK